MYNIEPMTLISFLDNNYQLPRFQRKPTWNKKQNFELCISVFQEYPVGVVIVNKEKNVSYLLDGRQRRSALKDMRENPVILYSWAMDFLKFNKTEDPLKITDLFWRKIAKYLQTESNETSKDSIEPDDAAEYEDEADQIEVEDDEVDSFNRDTQKKGLQTLLDIIQMVHQIKKGISAWESMFDYRIYFKKLIYTPNKNGERIIEPVRLRRFLSQLQQDCLISNGGDLTSEYFVDYYLQQYDISQGDAEKFKKYVEQNWKSIKNSIDVIEQSEKVFAERRIGIIQLTNASPLDAQNIFSRINSGGTQLKAEELLSAKPYWNITVDIISQDIFENVQKMYSKLNLPKPDFIVRWDIAATMISRIDPQHLIFDAYETAKKKNEISLDEITLGFKLISSIKNGGMSSRHVADIEKNDDINWGNDINILVDELNTVIDILMATDFFQTYQAWKKPITKLLGNAIALEFLTIIYLDWVKRNRPKVSSGELKALQRDARILFDRLVFEYATKVWRGSGDSKMANDIKKWQSRIVAVSNSDWEDLINSACEGTINGSATNVKTLKPILYYYYVLINSVPINLNNIMFDVDHIIPQEWFIGNNMVDALLENSLSNLALLPKQDNIAKRNSPLNKVTNKWLKIMITTYEGIAENNFEKYSDITNMVILKEERKELYFNAFTINRNANLSN